MQNAFDGLVRRAGMAEETASEPTDVSVGTSPTEKQIEKKWKKTKIEHPTAVRFYFGRRLLPLLKYLSPFPNFPVPSNFPLAMQSSPE